MVLASALRQLGQSDDLVAMKQLNGFERAVMAYSLLEDADDHLRKAPVLSVVSTSRLQPTGNPRLFLL